MIFLPVLTLIMYALFGVAPMAPVTPVRASEQVRQTPRRRNGRPCPDCGRLDSDNRQWQSDTAITAGAKAGGIDAEKKKRVKLTIQPRPNKGYTLRLSACTNKETSIGHGKGWGPPPKPFPSRSANRSSSYTLSKPTVDGVPRIGSGGYARGKGFNSSTVSKPINKRPVSQSTEKIHSKRPAENDALNKRLADSPVNKQAADKPKSSRITCSGSFRTGVDQVVSPLTGTVSGPCGVSGPTSARADKPSPTSVTVSPRKPSAWHSPYSKPTKVITSVSRDPKTRAVTVHEAETRPLSKTRPSAAPLPPRRWRF